MARGGGRGNNASESTDGRNMKSGGGGGSRNRTGDEDRGPPGVRSAAGRGGGTGVREDMRIKFTKKLTALRDDDVEEVVFPSTLTNIERKFLHQLSDELGLRSKSSGVGDNRQITVRKRPQDSSARVIDEGNIVTADFSPESVQILEEFTKLSGAKMSKYAFNSRADDQGVESGSERSASTLKTDLPRLLMSYRDAQVRRATHASYAAMEQKRKSLPAHHYKSAVCSVIKANNIVLVRYSGLVCI
jgi:ATP-dependent RNA helicase DHX36